MVTTASRTVGGQHQLSKRATEEIQPVVLVIRMRGETYVFTGPKLSLLLERAKAKVGHRKVWNRWTDAYILQHYRPGDKRKTNKQTAEMIAQTLSNRYGRPYTKNSVISRYNRKLKWKTISQSTKQASTK